jgi:hypothetical protein
LAKAQAKLTNPEKSLVATLPVERGQAAGGLLDNSGADAT